MGESSKGHWERQYWSWIMKGEWDMGSHEEGKVILQMNSSNRGRNSSKVFHRITGEGNQPSSQNSPMQHTDVERHS